MKLIYLLYVYSIHVHAAESKHSIEKVLGMYGMAHCLTWSGTNVALQLVHGATSKSAISTPCMRHAVVICLTLETASILFLSVDQWICLQGFCCSRL
jgi:hypothetical protein